MGNLIPSDIDQYELSSKGSQKNFGDINFQHMKPETERQRYSSWTMSSQLSFATDECIVFEATVEQLFALC